MEAFHISRTNQLRDVPFAQYCSRFAIGIEDRGFGVGSATVFHHVSAFVLVSE